MQLTSMFTPHAPQAIRIQAQSFSLNKQQLPKFGSVTQDQFTKREPRFSSIYVLDEDQRGTGTVHDPELYTYDYDEDQNQNFYVDDISYGFTDKDKTDLIAARKAIDDLWGAPVPPFTMKQLEARAKNSAIKPS
jgi:hypothetical protein